MLFCLRQFYRMKIFLNTKGKNRDETPERLVNFLQYVENSTDACVQKMDDVFVNRLHHHVTALKQSREWERRYMTFEEMLKDSKEEGREEGKEEARMQLLILIQKMNECGDGELVPQLADKDFFMKMCEKYQL